MEKTINADTPKVRFVVVENLLLIYMMNTLVYVYVNTEIEKSAIVYVFSFKGFPEVQICMQGFRRS